MFSLSPLRLIIYFLDPSGIFIQPYVIDHQVSFFFPFCFYHNFIVDEHSHFVVSLSLPNHFFSRKALFSLVYVFDNFLFPTIFMVGCTVFTTGSSEPSNTDSSLALPLYTLPRWILVGAKLCFTGSTL